MPTYNDEQNTQELCRDGAADISPYKTFCLKRRDLWPAPLQRKSSNSDMMMDDLASLGLQQPLAEVLLLPHPHTCASGDEGAASGNDYRIRTSGYDNIMSLRSVERAQQPPLPSTSCLARSYTTLML